MQKRARTEMNIEAKDMGQQAIRVDSCAVALPLEHMPAFLHYHNGMEIGICTDGIGLFYGRDFAENITQGDIVIFLPGHAHYSKSVDGCMCRFAYIQPKMLLADVFQNDAKLQERMETACTYHIPAVIRKSEHPNMHDLLHRLLTDLFSQKPPDALLTALQMGEFFLKIPKYFVKDGSKAMISAAISEDVIGTVEAFLSSRYYETITASRLCSICYLSESQLRRRFKQAYGVSPMQYVRDLRCRIASRFLTYTDLSVSEIARRVGYEDTSVFYRQFTACFKQSPTAFRKYKDCQAK